MARIDLAASWMVESCLIKADELVEIKETHEQVGDTMNALRAEGQIANLLRVAIGIHGPMEEELQKARPVITGFDQSKYRSR